MGTWRGLVAVAVAVLVGHPAQAEYVSWGKPGERREAFETGSRACMLKAARRDVAQDRATQKYLRGFEVMERENNMPPMPIPPSEDPTFVRSQRQVLLRRAYAPDRHTDTLQAQLQAEVDACLVQSGYVKFTLTPGQERQLRRYRPGTEARKRYLYALGSDGRIVEAQKVGR